MFFNSLLMSTMISISSNSWFGMWLGLEINLLSIIPLMNNIKNSYSSESSIKYFMVQVISSSFILLTMIFIMKFNYNNSINLIMNSSFLMKMGAAPFHFWFPEIMEGLNWMNCLIMLTWQKITPMIILNYILINLNFIMIIIMISIMIGSIMGINQNNLRKILTYSSINHIGWMISSIMFLEMLWIYYFLIYSIIIINIILILSKYFIFHLKQMFMFFNKNFKLNFIFIMNFFSLGGIPPFVGFFPKWLTIQMLILNNHSLLSYFMITFTLITLFYYMRLMFSTLNLNQNQIFFNKVKMTSMLLFSLINFFNLSSFLFCTILFNFI
uniref:NADH-ubiquinone oxidoreductase chain 2 n=1 Tax=Pselaphinae sp. 3 EF-2015 TaxID=1756857 RepID=A0A0S2M8R1_9COLE|nr:NADH deshydrogenase subunit 2 [Pselaphinae sp. 3 EF-2015]